MTTMQRVVRLALAAFVPALVAFIVMRYTEPAWLVMLIFAGGYFWGRSEANTPQLAVCVVHHQRGNDDDQEAFR